MTAPHGVDKPAVGVELVRAKDVRGVMAGQPFDHVVVALLSAVAGGAAFRHHGDGDVAFAGAQRPGGVEHGDSRILAPQRPCCRRAKCPTPAPRRARR